MPHVFAWLFILVVIVATSLSSIVVGGEERWRWGGGAWGIVHNQREDREIWRNAFQESLML